MAVPALQTDAVTNVTSNATTMEVIKPASIADDDVVLIGVSLDGVAGAANMDAETGWALIGSVSEGSVELFVFAKRITNAAGEPATWTVNVYGVVTSFCGHSSKSGFIQRSGRIDGLVGLTRDISYHTAALALNFLTWNVTE